MIPTFSRSWFRKITVVLDFEIAAVSLRRAWDMSRACRPTWESPISPSISALGTSAATESTTTTSTAPLRIGHDVERHRGLAGRLRAVELDDPTTRHAAHAEREVQRERAGRDHADIARRRRLAQLHDRALPVASLDLLDGGAERLLLFHGWPASWCWWFGSEKSRESVSRLCPVSA